MKLYRFILAATVVSLLFVSVPVFASGTDDSIEASVKQSFVFKTYLKDDDVTVQSKDGVVTLTGTVSEGSHKTLAQEYVASLPGVKSVENKLKEKDEVPAEQSDIWLISKIKATLLFHRNVTATETEVLVKDGTVTLRGNATSAAQKDLTTEYVKDVEGVKNVINEMKVPSTAKKAGETKMGVNVDAIVETIDDASVTALVKSTLLFHRSTSAVNTTVETNGGVVDLGGTAENAAEKDLVTKLVSDVHGVKKVINNMTVKGAKPTTN